MGTQPLPVLSLKDFRGLTTTQMRQLIQRALDGEFGTTILIPRHPLPSLVRGFGIAVSSITTAFGLAAMLMLYAFYVNAVNAQWAAQTILLVAVVIVIFAFAISMVSIPFGVLVFLNNYQYHAGVAFYRLMAPWLYRLPWSDRFEFAPRSLVIGEAYPIRLDMGRLDVDRIGWLTRAVVGLRPQKQAPPTLVMMQTPGKPPSPVVVPQQGGSGGGVTLNYGSWELNYDGSSSTQFADLANRVRQKRGLIHRMLDIQDFVLPSAQRSEGGSAGDILRDVIDPSTLENLFSVLYVMATQEKIVEFRPRGRR